MQLKSSFKKIAPPFIVDWIKLCSRYGWHGSYDSWQDAKSLCTGYDLPLILEKCKNSLLKVKNGEAVYERDSVIFDKVEYSWPVLAGLLHSAAQNNGKLHVLDFGGSLGSSYYQNRQFFSSLKEFSWNIVEQSNFVECGKANFEDDFLKFYYTVEQCVSERKVNVLLLSSVLQYLEDPYNWIGRFRRLGVEKIIVDRTTFIPNSRTDLEKTVIQKVPPSIYPATLPCLLFNKKKFVEAFKSRHFFEFDVPGFTPNMKYSGFIFDY